MSTDLHISTILTDDLGADWKASHEALVRLAALQCAHDFEEARAILAAFRSQAHLMLGCATFLEYLERVLGYRPRIASERLRVAEALEALPLLAEALRDGVLKWSAVREITRVATAATERAWIEAVRHRSVREIEQLVSGRSFGDLPSDRPDERTRRRVLTFEVTAETQALFREAIAKVRRDAGGGLDDDDALLMMARALLQGPRDEGRASYQVVVTRCPECRRVAQQGAGESLPVDPMIGEMAECDAQRVHIDRPLPEAVAIHSRTSHADRNAHVGELCVMAPPSIASASDAESMTRADGAARPESRPVIAVPISEDRVAHVDARRPRATQTIPPAVRREVLRRDGGRCTVPGCRSASWIDVHHVVPRNEGGDHDPSGLTVLCGAHHRAVHAGRLLVQGSWPTGLTFRHADGARYGAEVSPASAEAMAEAFAGLVALGYKDGEAHGALDAVRAQTAHFGTAEIIRAALTAIRSSKTRSP